MRTLYLICCSALALLLVFVVPASSVPPPVPSPEQGFEFKYTTGKPGTRTGLRFELSEQVPENANLRVLRTATVTLPAGMRVDRIGRPQCRASQDQLGRTFGAACLSSAVGAGVLVEDTGPNTTPRDKPVVSVLAYNTRDGMRLSREGVSVAFRGRQMTLTFPNFSINFFRISSIQLYLSPLSQRRRVHRHSGTVVVRRNLFTTPTRCPRSGVWPSSVRATFYDDPTPRTSVSRSPCHR